MMRALYLGLLFAALAPLAVQAQVTPNDTAGQRVEIVGAAPPACVIGQPAAGEADALAVPGAANSTVTFNNLIIEAGQDGAGLPANIGQTRPLNATLNYPATCTVAHALTIRSIQSGLARTGQPVVASGFRTLVPYTIAVNWAGETITATSESGVTRTVGGPATGTVGIRLAIPAGGLPLVAGDYADSVIVELTPSS